MTDLSFQEHTAHVLNLLVYMFYHAYAFYRDTQYDTPISLTELREDLNHNAPCIIMIFSFSSGFGQWHEDRRSSIPIQPTNVRIQPL